MKKILFLLLILLFLSSAYANSITIASVTSNPSEIRPGEKVYIKVRLDNQGNKDIN